MLTVKRVQCYFPKEGEKLKIPQGKIALTGHGDSAIFQGKRGKLNNPVKNSVNSTQGTGYFPRKEDNLNNPVKNSPNGTQGTVLFS